MDMGGDSEHSSVVLSIGYYDQVFHAPVDPIVKLAPVEDLCFDCGRSYKTLPDYVDGIDYYCDEVEQDLGVHIPPITKLSKPGTIVEELYEARCRLLRLKYLVEEHEEYIDYLIAGYEKAAPSLPKILEQALFIEQECEKMRKERGHEPTEAERKVIAEARSIKMLADSVREEIAGRSKLPNVNVLLDLLEEAHEMARCLREGDMTTQDVSRYFNDVFLQPYNDCLPRMNEVRHTHSSLCNLGVPRFTDRLKSFAAEIGNVFLDVQCRSLSYERWDHFLQRHAKGSITNDFDTIWGRVEGEEY